MTDIIQKTKDYSKFKLVDSNRDIDQSHVDDLIKRMKNHNLLSSNPIQVNEKFQVIDGQHRLEAAKKLGIEIYFIQNHQLLEKHIIDLNVTKKTWTLQDYMHHYCTKGNDEYLKLKQFIDENDISLQLAVALCDQWRSAKAMARFRDGDFVFNDKFGKELINKANSIIEMIKNRVGFKPYLRSTSFFKAICVILSYDRVDQDLFMNKLEMQIPKIGHQTSVMLYLNMFLDIYNYKMKSGKISIDDIEI